MTQLKMAAAESDHEHELEIVAEWRVLTDYLMQRFQWTPTRLAEEATDVAAECDAHDAVHRARQRAALPDAEPEYVMVSHKPPSPFRDRVNP